MRYQVSPTLRGMDGTDGKGVQFSLVIDISALTYNLELSSFLFSLWAGFS